MTDLKIDHNKIKCPYCKDAYMQFEFVVPSNGGNGKVDLEMFMSCENIIEKRCTGRMRVNASATRVESWESLKSG